MDDIGDMDGAPQSELPKRKHSRAKDSAEVQAYCELLREPITWAARRGTEGRILCEQRILMAGHWNRYLLLRERTQAAHLDWSTTKVRSHVMLRHFAYQGVIEERDKFYRWWAMMQPWLPDKMPLPNEVVQEAKNQYLGRPTKAESQQYHDATEAEQAYSALPSEAANEKIVAWVMAHRRVFLLRQNPPEEGDATDTTLSAADISGAPCKQAVTMLQEALANLKDFWRAMLSEQKKSTGKGGGQLDDFDEASDEEMLRLTQ